MTEKVKDVWMLAFTAASISAEFHFGQVDKAGQPYYQHPKRVAESIMTEYDFDNIDDECKIFALKCSTVAYLHDVLEDTLCTEDYLRKHGIPEDIIEGVKSVTQNVGETYDVFVKRAAENPYGKIVKLHDLKDNLDVKRLDHLTIDDLNIVNKYLMWYHYLMRVCGYE